MKTKLLVSLLLILPLLAISRQVSAQMLIGNTSVTNDAIARGSYTFEVESKKLDNRGRILSDYLASFNSPLQYHAEDFIEAADAYELDWKLIPAIAGVESTFGKRIPGGFNAWGWGVYGTQAIYFSSWRAGIYTLAKGLRENYLNKGLTDPYAMNRIYASSPTWGSKVAYFMQDIERFAEEYPQSNDEISQMVKSPNIAAVSGQLVLR